MKLCLLFGFAMISLASASILVEISQHVNGHGDSCCCGGCPCSGGYVPQEGNDSATTPSNDATTTPAGDDTTTTPAGDDTTTTATTEPACDINNGWRSYVGYCYKKFDEAKTWAQAQQACQDLGANLLILIDGTHTDFNFILDVSLLEYWVGCSYVEGVWVDPHGAPCGLFPASGTGCAYYSQNRYFMVSLSADNCTETKSYICGTQP